MNLHKITIQYSLINFCSLTVIVLGSCMNFIFNCELKFCVLDASANHKKFSSPQNFYAIRYIYMHQ